MENALPPADGPPEDEEATTGKADPPDASDQSDPSDQAPPPEAPEPPSEAPSDASEEIPKEYRVDLNVYAGPLDLLLYLIKRDELDINDIPIAHICREYVKYLDLFREWNVNMAGEFLVMAATLMEIKSRMLLPEPPPLEEDEEEEDPRTELVRQLLEYNRYTAAALALTDRPSERALRFSPPGLRIKDEEEVPVVPGVELWALVDAFQQVLAATGADKMHHVRFEDVPQEVLMARLEKRLAKAGRLLFVELFEGERSRPILFGMFLALLELCKLFVARAEQPEPFGEIWMIYVPAEERPISVQPVRPERGTFKRGVDAGREDLERSLTQSEIDLVEMPVDAEIEAEIDAVEIREVREHPPEPSVPATAANQEATGAATAAQPSKADTRQGEPPEMPAGPVERRAAPRVRLREGRVRYRVLGLFGICSCRYSPPCDVEDISEGGIRFRTRGLLWEGARLRMDLQDIDAPSPLRLLGVVRWRRPLGRMGNTEVGVRFEPFDDLRGHNGSSALTQLQDVIGWAEPRQG